MSKDHGYKCIVCGGKCPACTSATGWRTVACTTSHYQIFLVLREFQGARLDKAEARQTLLSLVEDSEEFIPAVANEIQKIMRDETVETEAPQEKKIRSRRKNKPTE